MNPYHRDAHLVQGCIVKGGCLVQVSSFRVTFMYTLMPLSRPQAKELLCLTWTVQAVQVSVNIGQDFCYFFAPHC